MRLNARAPIIIRGDEIAHLDADGYKHLPRAASLPDGKILASSGGAWRPSDLSGVSVSSVFGRTGAVAAQTGDYTAEQVGAAALVHSHAISDVANLQITLDDKLPKNNPPFTGTLSGPRALLSEVGLFKEDAGDATRGSWYGVGVTPGTNNFAFRAADDGSVAEMNGSSNIGLAIGGTNKIVIGSTAVVLQSGVGLIIANETVISDQREAALYSAQVDALAGAGSGLVLCDADGDLYRGALDPATIGAAKKPSKIDVSASANLGSIDASAIKVTATDVTLTCSGGFDGQGWDIIGPYAIGIGVPSGVTLYRFVGVTVGPATYAPGGGRALRVVRVDASTWIMPNLS